MKSPSPEEIELGKARPGGWVYRIAGNFGPSEGIPPEAIIGAWKVDDHGSIDGEFMTNPKYDEERWPSRFE